MNLENISKIYQTKNSEVIAINNVSYSFESGKFYAIMGHSGSGKSTLIKIMGLMDSPTNGKYYLNNLDITDLSNDTLAEYRNKYIGFIFQDYNLDEHLKAYENVMLPMIINPDIKRNDRKEKALKLLEKVGLLERSEHFPKEMSGGECARVAIARALANDPKVILADEPTGNLDKDNEDLIFKELKKLTQEGKCVVVVSHSPDVKKYADVILKLEHGKLQE